MNFSYGFESIGDGGRALASIVSFCRGCTSHIELLGGSMFMLQVSKTTKGIQFATSSELANIDDVIRKACIFFQDKGFVSSSEIKIVLRELLRNAIVHGNKMNEAKCVWASIECLENEYFKVTVQDQGEGFDFTAFDLKSPKDPRNMRNRGIFLVNQMVDGIKFDSDGRLASVIIRLTRKMEKGSVESE